MFYLKLQVFHFTPQDYRPNSYFNFQIKTASFEDETNQETFLLLLSGQGRNPWRSWPTRSVSRGHGCSRSQPKLIEQSIRVSVLHTLAKRLYSSGKQSVVFWWFLAVDGFFIVFSWFSKYRFMKTMNCLKTTKNKFCQSE